MLAFGRAILITCVVGVFSASAFSQDTQPEPALRSAGDPPSVEIQNSNLTAGWISKRPKVTYENGQLSIIAENSTLQQVLDAVREKTGTKVESAFLDNSKITVQLGPGDPVEILAKLLYGIRFNYIILGSDDHLRRPEKVIITPRSATAVAANFPPRKPVIPAPDSAANAETEPTADENAEGTATEQAKDEGEPKPDADKDKNPEDPDKVADKDANATDKDKGDPAVAALADAPAIAEEPSAAERMANLPEGVNPAIAALYPSLFGGAQNGATGPSGPNGSTISIPYGTTPQRGSQNFTPIPIQYNAAGAPILPSNIPPEIWNLYPNNLLDLIRNNNRPAYTQPATPLIPGSTGNGQGVLWNQGMTAPGHH